MFELAQRIYNLLDELRQDENKTYLLVATTASPVWWSPISTT